MPTISFTSSGENATRVAAAFGKQLNLQDTTDPENPVPRDATSVEVKRAIIQYVFSIVNAQEGQALRNAVVVPPLTLI